MRVGVDGRKIPQAVERGPHGSIDHARELGMDGLFFRTILDMSPTLDPGALRDIKSHADGLGMYLETGLGKVNPFATPEAPELRAVGDGDIRLGFERMMHACAAIDCRELWVGTGNFKAQYQGKWVYDRFRTDVSWDDQLAATEKFLHQLAPIARDLGIHLNVETHEEITTFECVRLVDAVGPDVMGITFDTANVLQRAEDPIQAAKRIAPYVRQSHIKDVALSFGADGIYRQPRTCGEGVIDFRAILSILFDSNPDLNLSIENPTGPSPLYVISAFDPVWLAAHPHLTVAEYASWIRLVKQFDDKVAKGDVEALQTVQNRPFSDAEAVSYIKDSAAYLRGLLAELDCSAHDPSREHAVSEGFDQARSSERFLGIYHRSLPDGDRLDARDALARARALGFSGCLFASPLVVSPTLDAGELGALKNESAELGIALGVGVGRIHPYHFGASTEVLRLGDGDFRAGLAKLVGAGLSLGCRELWFSVGSLADRFDRSVPWSLQLAAVEAFLRSFAPVLLDRGVRLNLKTHEEITSFEVVRLVEAVGADVLGCSFDPVNVLARLEDPVAAARRVAPYVHHVHLDDAALFFVPDGLERKLYPPGEGVVNWPAIMQILNQSSPPPQSWIELHRGQFRIPIFDPHFLDDQPDLRVDELGEIARLTVLSERRRSSGQIPPPDAYQSEPTQRLRATVDYFRSDVEAIA